MNSALAVPSQRTAGNNQQPSNKPRPPQYNMQEIKRHAGITPFADRLPLLSKDGFSKCPFHNGNGEKSFHVVQKEDGAFVGTCFSSCGRSWDAIDFREEIRQCRHGRSHPQTLKPNYRERCRTRYYYTKALPGVPDVDNAMDEIRTGGYRCRCFHLVSASRPNSKTPSVATLNAMGFKIAENYGQVFLVAPYRLGDTFYTLKARNLKTKEFIQQHSVSQKGLFNIDAVTAGCDVYIVESELDAAVLHENGYTAVSESSTPNKSQLIPKF